MIEKLPELVLTKVFKHLQIFDQLAIRPVCKSWKAVVENWLFSRRELILFHETLSLPLVWFHDDSPVDLSNSLISNDQFKASPFFWQIFQNIRRLYIVCYQEFIHEPDHFDFLNRFTHLEHLQVDVLQYDAVENRFYCIQAVEIRLNLPNLRSFCSFSKKGSMILLGLDCPKLEQFSAPCLFRVDERCASCLESLRLLMVRSYSFQSGFCFPNLETFLFEMVGCMAEDRLKIALHPKLKEIQLYSSFIDGQHSFQYINRFELACELFEQKERLERHELNLFCHGLRWTPDTAEGIHQLPRTYLNRIEAELFRENSEDLKLEHAKRNLIYIPDVDSFLSTLNEQQLERLARCIEAVELLAVLNPALSSNYKILFRYVRVLILSEQFQEQRDLDRLPELFPHLLEIKEGALASLVNQRNSYEGSSNPAAFPNLFRKVFNFEFLAKFPALTRLETDRWTLSRSELERILQNCRFLREIKLSRRQLMGSLETPIRIELSIYTISSPRSAIKMQVSRHPIFLPSLPENLENNPRFIQFRRNATKQFSSLEELLIYLSLDGCFFEEN